MKFNLLCVNPERDHTIIDCLEFLGLKDDNIFMIEQECPFQHE